jgi:hypothetical protein
MTLMINIYITGDLSASDELNRVVVNSILG